MEWDKRKQRSEGERLQTGREVAVESMPSWAALSRGYLDTAAESSDTYGSSHQTTMLEDEGNDPLGFVYVGCIVRKACAEKLFFDHDANSNYAGNHQTDNHGKEGQMPKNT
jgi:hypothetical protein